jgi:ribonuclease D
MPAYTFVEQPDALASRLLESGRVGLDTEFMREKTFLSQLCLVQLAVEDEIFCIDPLAPAPLAGFWETLAQNSWVVHSGRQDIEVIFQTAKVMPASLFDTQIAAALLGFQPQIGYAALVRELFDVELPKSHTRANWARRPLPAEYLEYAAEDVEYLLPAAAQLAERLDAAGRLEWALSDSAALLEPALYEIRPETAIERVKAARNFRGARRVAATRLAAWRERQALEKNLPRQWIIKDNVLAEIAYKLPETRSELAKIGDLPPRVARRIAADVLEIVAAAGEPPEGTVNRQARRTGPLEENEKSVLSRMQSIVAECAADLGIAAETIASKKELSAALLEGSRDSRVFSGWRRQLVGDRLAELL